jgi:uncharacterized protein YdaU (DUF1376 family)
VPLVYFGFFQQKDKETKWPSRQLGKETSRQRDKEIRRQGDNETKKKADKKTRGHGDINLTSAASLEY